jgi:hypothetical protein
VNDRPIMQNYKILDWQKVEMNYDNGDTDITQHPSVCYHVCQKNLRQYQQIYLYHHMIIHDFHIVDEHLSL